MHMDDSFHAVHFITRDSSSVKQPVGTCDKFLECIFSFTGSSEQTILGHGQVPACDRWSESQCFGTRVTLYFSVSFRNSSCM